MIPTLFGITFMVFMIIALSPGGLAAGLQLGPGATQTQGEGGAAVVEAYLEDRYGLNDPAPVQYLRWLSRISPIKFTKRDQESPDGQRLSAPRPINPPELVRADWLPIETVTLDAGSIEPTVELEGLGTDELAGLYKRVRSEYANARGQFIRASKLLEIRAVDYAEAVGIEAAIESETEVRVERLVRTPFDAGSAAAAELLVVGEDTARIFNAAARARANEMAVFDAHPLPRMGIGVDGLWLGAPDLGQSFTRSQDVLELIGDRLPVTMLLNVLAIPVIYCIAIPAGVLAATRRDTLIDTVIGAFFVALWALPRVGVGVLAIGYLADSNWMSQFGLPHLPTGGLHSDDANEMLFLPSSGEDGFRPGYLLDMAWHLALPVLCVAYSGFAVLSKQTRAAMLENFNADFVRTARAKGVAPGDVTLYHVFRNSLLPLITMFVTIFPAMFAGSIIIEEIFSIEGMGKLAIDAIRRRDREVLLGVTLITTIVNLLALLLADILYAIADPRVSYD
ncbi:MAG: ABC transporter permease [Planctomycetota bacterium]